MSKSVDQRVVSMQFDNKDFEQRATQSMSTLDKLKQKLNLSGAAKGLNEVNAASKKVDFSEMENAAYRSGFHIQDIWLKTASVLEYQVARKIIDAGKRIISELTVAPISDGWSEYELTMNAVQTTMAATGKTAAQVEEELKKLDEYADKTVYSTADMLNNLPKFTNANVPLETATQAMIGIANATALAGGDASKASIAFYNLGQAIGTGYLTRMDYNSINNAGIATMQWKEEMVKAAIAQGTLTKVGEDAYSTGKKTLTLQQLFIDGLQDQWATTDVMLKVFGDYGDETTNIGKRAYAAAQDVKTFTMMMDSLKATAGTGWKDTWQIIFGGLEEAKKFWTNLANFFGNIINSMNNWRNSLLGGALMSPVAKITEKIESITNVAEGAGEAIKDLGTAVNDVLDGKYGNGQKRWDALTEAGYDWAKVQNKVNEIKGDSTRHQEQATEATEEATEATIELTDAKLEELGVTRDELDVYNKLQEISKRTGIPLEEINGRMLLLEGLRNIGRNLIDIFREFKNAWTETFEAIKPVQLLNLIDKFHKWTESIRFSHEQTYKLWKTFHGLVAIIDIAATIVGGAFRIAFNIVKELLSYFHLDLLDVTAAIGTVIVRFRNWLKSLINVKSIVEVIGPIIEKAVNAVRGWIKSIKESKAFVVFTSRISKMTAAIKDWFAGMKDAENIPQYIANGIGTAIGHVLKFIRDMIVNLGKFVTGGFKEIPGMMTDGFLGGLWNGIKSVGAAIVEFGKTIINKICEVLGIQSPSRVFFSIAGFAIAGFVLGFRDKIGTVFPALGEFANGVINYVKNINFGKVFALAGSIAVLAFTTSISQMFTSVAGVLRGVGDMIVAAIDVIQIFGKGMKRMTKAISRSLNALAFKQFAISIAILVGSIVVLALIAKQEGMVKNLWIAVGIVAALAAIMVGMFAAISALNTPKGGDPKTVVVNMAGLTTAILAIAGSIFIIALAAKMIGKMSWDDMKRAGVGLLFLAGIMVGLMAATQLIAKSTSSAKTLNGSTKMTSDIANIGRTLTQLAASILILVIAAKLIGSMSWDEMAKAGAGLVVLAGIMVGLMAATKLVAKTKAGSINAGLLSIGKMLLQIALSILVLVLAAKMIASMSWSEMAKAGVGLVVLAGIMVGLIAATQLIAKTAKGNISTGLEHTGKMLLQIALAIGILAVAAKIIASMSWSEMGKALVGIIALSGIVVGLVAVTKLAGGNDLKGVAATLFAMALVIGVMAASAALLSLLDPKDLSNGIVAIAALGMIIALMVLATKGAGDARASMIGIAITIAVMAASIALLSFIDPQSLFPASIALGIVMGMLALIVSQAGKAQGALGVMIVMAVIIAVMAAALFVLSSLPIANMISSAVSLSILMLAMTATLALLKTIGSSLTSALKGVLALTAMAVPLIAFVGVLAAMSGVQNALSNVTALTVLAAAMTLLLIPLAIIGSTAGFTALIGVLALTAMAVPLIAFVGVLAAMSGVQNALVNAAALSILATTMTLLLIPLSAIGAMFAMALIGMAALTAMAAPMLAFVGVLAAMSGVENSLTNALALVTLVSALTLLMVPLAAIGALAVPVLVGIGLLTTMAAPLAAFGHAITEFSNNVANVNVSAVKAACEAGMAITEMASTIPNQGGIVSWFAGDNSLASFAPQIVTFGQALAAFSDAVSGINPMAVVAAALAGKTIAEMANLIPNQGGVKSWFAGDNSLAAFSPQIVTFGQAMASFSEAVQSVVPDNVRAAVDAGKALVDMTNIIPTTGGIKSWFSGSNSLASFAPQIVKFGNAIADFSDTVKGISVDAVRAASEAGKSIADLASSISAGKLANLEDIGKQFHSFADELAKACSKLSFGVNFSSISNLLTNLDTALSSLGTVGKTSVDFSTSAVQIVKSFAKTIISETKTATKAVEAMMSSLVATIKDYRDEFKSAGGYVVDGFAAGITARTWKAEAKATAMARAAIAAAKKALSINSPSKVFREVGKSVPEGFAMGISMLGGMVESSVEDMASGALDGTKSAIARISDVINSDIDTQPTIRPVLDLSDVESGANSIGGMFDMAPSVGMLTNVGAISSMMNNRQNVGNSDIISALRDLESSLSGRTGDTYTINGITYDDGSNISEAVKSLVRAARIERRV